MAQIRACRTVHFMSGMYSSRKQMIAVAMTAALLAVFVAVGASTFAHAGDIDNPTSASDCYRQPMKYIATKRLHEQYSACFDNAARMSTSNIVSSYQTTCMGKWAKACGQFMQKKCDVEAKYGRRQAQCLIKMRKLALDQKHIKEQQEQFQREQRQAEQRRQDAESKRRSDMYTQLNQVQKYKDSAILGGHLAGHLGGATQPPISGSYYLSQAISQAGTRFITGSTAEALLQLEAALYSQPARAGVRLFTLTTAIPLPIRDRHFRAKHLHLLYMKASAHRRTGHHQQPIGCHYKVVAPQAGHYRAS